MSWPADYHMHTPLCRHAKGEPSDYARHALELGFDEIGFSDHSPMPRDDFDDWRMRLDQLSDYVARVDRARREAPSLTIKLALEVDFLPGQEEWVRDLAGRYPWDYLIGSVHYVTESWDIDNPHRIALWQGRDLFEVWTAYFERLTRAAESGLFDIIGHADLCKKFGFRPAADCTPLYRRFLASARRADVAIELNTAGLRKECREIYPSRTLLELAHQEGVAIAFGSDAHDPEEVGADFEQAVALARSVGYTHACRWTRRERTTVSLLAPGPAEIKGPDFSRPGR
ncbi:MAG TPA: histidinol-phosphatase HisJ family protein [Verrucomicrobiota bacterium]|nr:histidinol-phosphatase HisJ family protein [Verrucomicrobiota bacterium]HRZ39122.1 histidinol-phosphatase HisJ family protein [Candidatus Paceibacterota bacterium]